MTNAAIWLFVEKTKIFYLTYNNQPSFFTPIEDLMTMTLKNGNFALTFPDFSAVSAKTETANKLLTDTSPLGA